MGSGPFFFGVNKIMLNRRADKLELLRIAEAVALEKSIDKSLLIVGATFLHKQFHELFQEQALCPLL